MPRLRVVPPPGEEDEEELKPGQVLEPAIEEDHGDPSLLEDRDAVEGAGRGTEGATGGTPCQDARGGGGRGRRRRRAGGGASVGGGDRGGPRGPIAPLGPARGGGGGAAYRGGGERRDQAPAAASQAVDR